MKRFRNWLASVSLPDSPPPWSLTSALITVIFAFVALIIGAGVALVWAGTQDYTQLAGLTLGGILIILFVWQTRRQERAALRLTTSPTPLLFVMFVSFGCALALDLLGLAVTSDFLPAPELLRLNPNALGVAQWGFSVAFMVIIQPIAEGLVFRAVLLPALRTVISGWGGVLIAAAISAAFHYLIYPPDYVNVSSISPLWYGLVVPLVGAILFGAVRASSKSTRAAIAAQIAFGLFAVVKLVTLTGSA